MRLLAIRSSRQRSTVAAIALAVVAGTLLLARPAGAQVDVHVVWPHETARFRFLDFGRPGIRIGDRLEARGPLLDETGTSEVGSAYLDCIAMSGITAPEGGLYRCSYVLHLEDGDLVVEGLDPHEFGVSPMAVLGGTGAFARAAGEAMLTYTDTETDFSIDLSR
jgi:hypothetical protein